ncbi:unnamed protein product [Protopolystoma xenopodis]|uniref:Uncharacterized protein n=1 Tax=Protopolystoma xenopodis TaxID=117903 RepID=A0A448X571_9PLAT|nr:unnamed protein product [Protopolystoma xenopodis]
MLPPLSTERSTSRQNVTTGAGGTWSTRKAPLSVCGQTCLLNRTARFSVVVAPPVRRSRTEFGQTGLEL